MPVDEYKSMTKRLGRRLYHSVNWSPFIEMICKAKCRELRFVTFGFLLSFNHFNVGIILSNLLFIDFRSVLHFLLFIPYFTFLPTCSLAQQPEDEGRQNLFSPYCSYFSFHVYYFFFLACI